MEAVDSKEDWDKQKDNSLHALCLLGVRDGTWKGALGPQPKSEQRETERYGESVTEI